MSPGEAVPSNAVQCYPPVPYRIGGHDRHLGRLRFFHGKLMLIIWWITNGDAANSIDRFEIQFGLTRSWFAAIKYTFLFKPKWFMPLTQSRSVVNYQFTNFIIRLWSCSSAEESLALVESWRRSVNRMARQMKRPGVIIHSLKVPQGALYDKFIW